VKRIAQCHAMSLVFCIVVFASLNASAHCDTLNGPVVRAARRSLEIGDVLPVLKWVRPEYETEVRQAFTKTEIVRRQSAEARALADRYFFETVVRLHRAGEGEPYDGLKEADAADPAVAALDRALELGDVGVLATVADHSDEIRPRFVRLLQMRQRADDDLIAGRAYVAAYVALAHSLESHRDAEPHLHAASEKHGLTTVAIERFTAEKSALKKNGHTKLNLTLRTEPADAKVDWKLTCDQVLITGWKSAQILSITERSENGAIRSIEGHGFSGTNPAIEIVVKRPKMSASTQARCTASVRAGGVENEKTVAFDLR